jgi:2-C-methyl-D-erythritol 2,4-cyclodiphosphate synthase
MTIRVGQGFDAHAFAEGRALVLGGVRIEGVPGLAGHSDADVLSHAIADALLGSVALGDLGTHFPDDDRWRDASSLDILRETARLLDHAGWTCVNVDATVVAEGPKLAPYLPEARANIARALGIERSVVSLKATTSDGMGFTGRGEGMAALAVVLVQR